MQVVGGWREEEGRDERGGRREQGDRRKWMGSASAGGDHHTTFQKSHGQDGVSMGKEAVKFSSPALAEAANLRGNPWLL